MSDNVHCCDSRLKLTLAWNKLNPYPGRKWKTETRGNLLQGDEQRLADMNPHGTDAFGHCQSWAGWQRLSKLPGDRPGFKCSHLVSQTANGLLCYCVCGAEVKSWGVWDVVVWTIIFCVSHHKSLSPPELSESNDRAHPHILNVDWTHFLNQSVRSNSNVR